MGNMVDSMGFEEVNQTVTSTEYISGTYVYATTSGTIAKFSATNSAITTMSGTTVNAGTVNGAGKSLSPAGTGSPITWGKLVESDVFVTSAGSSLWYVFRTAFGSVPNVVSSGFTGTTDAVWVNAAVAGSAQFYSASASKSGTFIAIG